MQLQNNLLSQNKSANLSPIYISPRFAGAALRRLLASLILLVLWFIVCLASFSNVGTFAGIYPAISLRYHTPITSAAAQASRDYAHQNAASAPFWPTFWAEHTEKFKAEINSVNGTCLWYSGNGALVAPVKFLSGTYPGAADDTGCALSTSLSWALWGSFDVIGKSLEIDGKTYYVRGVFEDTENKAFAGTAEANFTKGWQAVELESMQENTSKTDADTFAVASGLGAPNSFVAPAGLLNFMLILSFLPLCFLLAYFLFVLLRGLNWHTRFKKELAFFGLALLFALLLPYLLSILPAVFIPTRWSDFSFWTNLLTKGFADLKNFLAVHATTKDINAKLLIISQCLLFFTNTLLSIALGQQRMKHKNKP